MSITKEIKARVERELTPVHYELINESDLHLGHAGHDGSGESHFKLLVVSSRFDECNRVQRTRVVNKLLLDLFDKGLHALSLSLKTPEEHKK